MTTAIFRLIIRIFANTKQKRNGILTLLLSTMSIALGLLTVDRRKKRPRLRTRASIYNPARRYLSLRNLPRSSNLILDPIKSRP